MKTRKVIHLELFKDNSHHYFGSLKALCDTFGKDDIGIVYSSLRAVNISETKEYRNPKCIIRQGVIITSKNLN
jgi:hypothetical protein